MATTSTAQSMRALGVDALKIPLGGIANDSEVSFFKIFCDDSGIS
jgi:hypothetical protein